MFSWDSMYHVSLALSSCFFFLCLFTLLVFFPFLFLETHKRPYLIDRRIFTIHIPYLLSSPAFFSPCSSHARTYTPICLQTSYPVSFPSAIISMFLANWHSLYRMYSDPSTGHAMNISHETILDLLVKMYKFTRCPTCSILFEIGKYVYILFLNVLTLSRLSTSSTALRSKYG